MQDFLISLVKGVLFALFMSFWMYFGNKLITKISNSKQENDSEMRCPRGFLILGLLGLTFFVSLAIFFPGHADNEIAFWFMALGFGIASLPGLILVIIYFAGYYKISDEGLTYKPTLGKDKHIKWSEIEQVSSGFFITSILLKTKKGDVMRAPLGYTETPRFAELLLKYVAIEAIEKDCLDIIKNAAQGELPLP